MTIRRPTSSRKDDTKGDSLSQKEDTHSKAQKNVPKLELDMYLVNQNRECKFSMIARNGEGSKI